MINGTTPENVVRNAAQDEQPFDSATSRRLALRRVPWWGAAQRT